jgi:hypothetical protein
MTARHARQAMPLPSIGGNQPLVNDGDNGDSVPATVPFPSGDLQVSTSLSTPRAQRYMNTENDVGRGTGPCKVWPLDRRLESTTPGPAESETAVTRRSWPPLW